MPSLARPNTLRRKGCGHVAYLCEMQIRGPLACVRVGVRVCGRAPMRVRAFLFLLKICAISLAYQSMSNDKSSL